MNINLYNVFSVSDKNATYSINVDKAKQKCSSIAGVLKHYAPLTHTIILMYTQHIYIYIKKTCSEKNFL